MFHFLLETFAFIINDVLIGATNEHFCAKTAKLTKTNSAEVFNIYPLLS